MGSITQDGGLIILISDFVYNLRDKSTQKRCPVVSSRYFWKSLRIYYCYYSGQNRKV